MTIRERTVINYSSKLAVALRRHAELNGEQVIDQPAERVRLLLDEIICDGTQTYAEEVERFTQTTASWKRLRREIVRRVEAGECVRRDHWAAKV